MKRAWRRCSATALTILVSMAEWVGDAQVLPRCPPIDVSGRAFGQDDIDAAIQTTSTSKVRRVDFGGCGPPQRTGDPESLR